MKKNAGKKIDDAAKKQKTPAPSKKVKAPAAPAEPAAASTPAVPAKPEPRKSPKTSAAPKKPKSVKVTAAKPSAKSKIAPPGAASKPADAIPVASVAENKTAPPPKNPIPAVKLEKPKREPDVTIPPPSTSAPPVSKAKLTPPLPGSKSKPGKRPIRSADPSRPEVKIPSLLLEGDLPPGPSVSGPGARYALAPQPVVHPSLATAGELPESYGTGRVFLAARDPHWLYVSWDFTAEQQNRFNAQSRDRHLIIRVFARGESASAVPEVPEVHVHPESKNWFVHVPFAATTYHAEIGFYNATGIWHRVAVSQKTLTPPEAPSTDLSAEFATIPAEVTFQQVVEAVQQFVSVSKNEPLLEAVAQASEAQREQLAIPQIILHEQPPIPRVSKTRIGPASDLPRASRDQQADRKRDPLPIKIYPADEWSEEQSIALSRLIHIDSFRRVWMGSMEITELVRRQLEEEIASIAAARRKRPAVAAEGRVPRDVTDISSPSGGEFARPGKFWFKINAELIIYGATEPDARVTIADRLIKLRPDGTFSFRFSLPDGRYQLPAVAISADAQEGREARLEFSRSTDYRGHVEAHPQDAALRPPRPDHLE